VSIIILFGGTSGERRVSVASAQNFAGIVNKALLWFIAPDETVWPVERGSLSAFLQPFEKDFAPGGKSLGSLEAALDQARGSKMLLALHGGAGEDGTVQAMLEARHIPFTGSGSAASARAFDKVVAKNVVRVKGIKVADSVVLPQAAPDACRAALADMFSKHGRVVVKRIADGSSVGLYHVCTAEDVEKVAAIVAGEPNTPYLAEAFLKGREMTCGVVEMHGALRALPPSEVIMAEGRTFDFEGKYMGKGTTEITPAEAPEELLRAVQEVAIISHTALGCRGYSRTDVIITERGPHFLETNTLPGMTKASFLPQQLAAAGINIGDFVHEQLRIAG